MFLEHKRLYREPYGKGVDPGPDFMIPFGKARIVQAGTDVTVITYGAVVPRALQAAQKADREDGIKVDLIDLRSLVPTTGRQLPPRYARRAGSWSPTKTPELGIRRRDCCPHCR